ncbi:MAG: alkaline phosphatase family protein [Bacteroidota bacterium]|nr:alkaline phosphatase family protein [Bacteroidota bacterium]
MHITRKLIYSILTILLTGYGPLMAQKVSRPKLVVGIVVDQMRWDYLYRYYPLYEQGGFKRLLQQGFQCEDTYINYLPSYTAVGHSTIFTGSVPAIDGITGNDWIDQLTDKHWYCTEDSSVSTVGSSSNEGKMSPHNLLVSTVTDELRLATNFQSRVVGVSLKDRASILPAGHTANAAFWFDDATGNFITSTYYMNALPAWVNAFNKKNEPVSLTSGQWNTLLPLKAYSQSTADDEPWEGTFPGETSPVFPHNISNLVSAHKEIIRSTPFGNTLTLNFAKAAIDGYHLGNGPSTDFLTINCASTDYVGHMYGPNSVEIEDVYLRLDRDLASFFSFLDKKVGKGNYVVFLTADHGVAHTVSFMKSHHLPAGLFDARNINTLLNQQLEEKFGVGGLVTSEMNYHMNFNRQKIEQNHLDFDAIRKFTVQILRKQPGISFAVDLDHISDAAIPAPIKTMIINGYYAKRCSPVIVIPNPGWYAGSLKGTTHGNWNPYDTHIPLIFMGWHIPHGSTYKEIKMTDIAPTIAALLHIQAPNGSVGKVIRQVVHSSSVK